MTEELTGRKIYDPRLGKERDAFPEELIPEDEQTPLQRLMAAERARYKALEDTVADTFPPEKLRVLREAGLLAAEKKREEYLKALAANPETILLEIFGKLQEEFSVGFLETITSELASTTRTFEGEIKKAKARNAAIGAGPFTTQEYAKSLLAGQARSTLVDLRFGQGGRIPRDGYTAMEKALAELDAFPTPEFKTIEDLKLLGSNRNDPEKPFFATSLTNESGSGSVDAIIGNLAVKKPGLEGLYVRLLLPPSDPNQIRAFRIEGDENAIARIIDARERLAAPPSGPK